MPTEPWLGSPSRRRTIVVGAGKRAEQLVRDAHQVGARSLNVVGLLDLDGSRKGQTLGGVQVIGTVDELPSVAERLHVELGIIALEPGDTPEMRRVVERCIAAELEFTTLPPLSESHGAGGTNQLRNVRIEDLFGHRPVALDLTRVRADLHNRVVLLTGAAGSIGSELARQIAAFAPARLVLLDQSESDLYFLHLELHEAHPELNIVSVICDITNQNRLAQIFAQHHPDYVIHAAAYKHVPLMETNVLEAVRNNVLGTLHVATIAARYGAAKMLLISSDKAIKPSSVMGATKRTAERIIFGLHNLHRSGTDFRVVRFGNVLASRGSVIPLFERQLAAGGPLTVTHPEARRYFMTIPEAAQLVLQAGSLPETAGAIAMLEMGEPVRILDLAEKLIRFSGRVPGRDIEIVFTGLRPGEKLTEEQISLLEATVPTSMEGIRISQTTEPAGPELGQQLSRLLACLDLGDHAGCRTTLCELVPECVSPLRGFQTDPALIALSPGTAVEPWISMIDPLDASRRKQRRSMVRLQEPPELRVIDRREGLPCRRKTPRVGGRRRTDTKAFQAAAGSLH